MRTTITMITTALAVSLSSVAMATETLGETPFGLTEEMVQAICDGDMEAYKATYNNEITLSDRVKESFNEFHEACQNVGISKLDISSRFPEEAMQNMRKGIVEVDILMNDGEEYTSNHKVVWSAYRPPMGAEKGVEAWRIGGMSPSIPEKPVPIEW